MNIYQDSLIELEYEPKTDILFVKWPNLVDVPLPVIEHSFAKLTETIRFYNVSKALFDFKGTHNNVPIEDYKKLTSELIAGLTGSNLKKVARVISEDSNHEKKVRKRFKDIEACMASGFANKKFYNKESALAWLASNEN